MKNILFGLISLFLASQLFVSCSSEIDVMSQFSKRKYLKKFKDKNIKQKDDVNKLNNNIDYNVASVEYASTDIEPTSYQLSEIEAIDNSSMVELKEENESKLSLIKERVKDYSTWNNYNRRMGFSKMNMETNSHENNSGKVVNSQRASDILIVILCIFLPPVAVLIYEDTVTVNFWVDLVGTLLFWLPGMILAFLICFADVSFG